MQLLHSLPPNRSDSCDESLELPICPKCSFFLPLSQQARFLRSRVWNVLMCPKCSFFTLSPNRSDSCDQEFGMFSSVRNSASSLSLSMAPILEIKSLKCLIYPKCRFFTLSSNRSGSDLSEIQPIWRSRAWNVLISPKRSFFALSSNRSNSCHHELGMSDLSEMQLQ
jgi:hypothetical protein